jgi:hypothetical protein
MFIEIENDANVLYIQEDDKCYTCSKNIEICPLIEAINGGVVVMCEDGIDIIECADYKERPKDND